MHCAIVQQWCLKTIINTVGACLVRDYMVTEKEREKWKALMGPNGGTRARGHGYKAGVSFIEEH